MPGQPYGRQPSKGFAPQKRGSSSEDPIALDDLPPRIPKKRTAEWQAGGDFPSSSDQAKKQARVSAITSRALNTPTSAKYGPAAHQRLMAGYLPKHTVPQTPDTQPYKQRTPLQPAPKPDVERPPLRTFARPQISQPNAHHLPDSCDQQTREKMEAFEATPQAFVEDIISSIQPDKEIADLTRKADEAQARKFEWDLDALQVEIRDTNTSCKGEFRQFEQRFGASVATLNTARKELRTESEASQTSHKDALASLVSRENLSHLSAFLATKESLSQLEKKTEETSQSQGGMIEQLVLRVSAVETSNNELKSQLDDKGVVIESLWCQVSTLCTKQEALEMAINATKSEVRTLSDQHKSVEKRSDTMDGAIGSLGSQVLKGNRKRREFEDKWRASRVKQDEKIAAVDSTCSQLSTTIEKLKASQEKVEAMQMGYEKEIATIGSAADELATTVQGITDCQKEVKSIRIDQDKKIAAVESTYSQLSTNVKEVKDCQEKVEAVQAEMDEKVTGVELTSFQLSIRIKELTAHLENVEAMQAESKDKVNTVKAIGSLISATVEQVESLEGKIRAMQAEVDAAPKLGRIETLEELQVRLRDRLEHMSRQIAPIETKSEDIKRLTTRLDKLKTTLDKISAQVSTLSEKEVSLEKKIEELAENANVHVEAAQIATSGATLRNLSTTTSGCTVKTLEEKMIAMGTRIEYLSRELAIVNCSRTAGSDTGASMTPQIFGSVQPRSFSELKLGQLEESYNSLKEQVQALKEKLKLLDQQSGALDGKAIESNCDLSAKVAQLGIAVNKIDLQVNTMAQDVQNLHKRLVGVEKQVFVEGRYTGSFAPMTLQNTLFNSYVLQRPTGNSTHAQPVTVNLTGNGPHPNDSLPQQQPGQHHPAHIAADPLIQVANRLHAEATFSQRPPQPVARNPQSRPGTIQQQERAPQLGQQPFRGPMAFPGHLNRYRQRAAVQPASLSGPE